MFKMAKKSSIILMLFRNKNKMLIQTYQNIFHHKCKSNTKVLNTNLNLIIITEKHNLCNQKTDLELNLMIKVAVNLLEHNNNMFNLKNAILLRNLIMNGNNNKMIKIHHQYKIPV